MRTARERPSPGICSRCSNRRSPSNAWSSTRSPARRSNALWRTPATSTPRSSTHRRPVGSSTVSTATRSHPCCGARSEPGLSAGRVQSVATRLVVERERERMAFVPADYWDLDIDLGLPDRTNPFAANLTTLDGARVASGRDFNDKGQLKNISATVVDQALGGSSGHRTQRQCEERSDGVRGGIEAVLPAARPPRSRPRRCSRKPAASCA